MEWRDCVVVYMDLPDLKKEALAKQGRGSSLMRTFHSVLAEALSTGFPSLDHAYAWNDSVLLLAYVGASAASYTDCLRDVDLLKRQVDARIKRTSYAIAVKGQTFPGLPFTNRRAVDRTARLTILRTASYAMGNCFAIEKEAKSRKLRKAWYLDVRIARRVPQLQSTQWISVPLLPTGKSRRVYVHAGYLWDGI